MLTFKKTKKGTRIAARGRSAQALFDAICKVHGIEPVKRQARCVQCGCTDERACPGGCHWVHVDRDKGTGLCSRCG